MSKKKAFSGSTMTLRDFHGGSIPSDLPLPSAPGMVVERKNDRPGSGGWMGSSLHRGFGGERVGFSRQGSGTFARSYEEKVSYLPNPASIGRNYEEDERKPVDGHNRRGQGQEVLEDPLYEQRQVALERLPERFTPDNRGGYAISKFSDLRAERRAQEELSSNPAGSSLRLEGFSRRPSMYQQDLQLQPNSFQEHIRPYSPQLMNSVPPHSPYQTQELGQPWRQNRLGQQLVTPGSMIGSGSGVQNVWTARREGEYSRTDSSAYVVSDTSADAGGQTPIARIVQASALEKISSGRWNSRILQSPIESPQVYTNDYGQSHVSAYEGGGNYLPYTNVMSPVDADRSVYADSYKNNSSRGSYPETGRGIDIRDTRFDAEKVGPHDVRREHLLEGRGLGQVESNRHADDRHAYGETGWRGSTGHREPARFLGTKDGMHTEPGYASKDPGHFGVNEATSFVNETDPYVEARSSVQSSPGWSRSDPSARGDYGDGLPKEPSKGLSLDFERRGLTNRDFTADNENSTAHKSFNYEGQKERRPQYDGPYHATSKENSGHSTPFYPKSRDDFSHEVSDSARMGHYNERTRGTPGSDLDHSHAEHLHSPGGAHTFLQEMGTAANISAVESEAKGTPAERPKLKLLPRTKPLDPEQTEELTQEGLQDALETGQFIGLPLSEDATGSGSMVTGPNAIEECIQTTERPKLSLKPRSQPVDAVPVRSGSMKERMSVFGGARPRELVLKERGVDESVIVGTDPIPTPSPATSVSGSRAPVGVNRVSSGGPSQGMDKQEKVEEKSKRTDHHDQVNARQAGRQDSGRLERMESRGKREQIEKDERRASEYRHHQEKWEPERPDVDKQDSWRRPVEVYNGLQTPVPAGEQLSGGAGRTIQSAADLAQAFSRSSSFGSGLGGTAAKGFMRSPMPRSPGPGLAMGLDSPGLRKASPSDVPFSRLTEAISPVPQDYQASGAQGRYRNTSAF